MTNAYQDLLDFWQSPNGRVCRQQELDAYANASKENWSKELEAIYAVGWRPMATAPQDGTHRGDHHSPKHERGSSLS
jgi:hypothetical protein